MRSVAVNCSVSLFCLNLCQPQSSFPNSRGQSMLPARLTPSPADLAFCLPLFVLSLSSPCHGICTAWGLPQPPHVAELVPSSREDLWELLMFLDLPRTYLNPADRPWPSEQPSTEFELVCSECRWDFPVKASNLASPASLFPPHLLRCSVEQWLTQQPGHSTPRAALGC